MSRTFKRGLGLIAVIELAGGELQHIIVQQPVKNLHIALGPEWRCGAD